MKRALIVLLSLGFFCVSARADNTAANTAGSATHDEAGQRQARSVDDPAPDITDSDLPTVSRFQTPVAPHIGCFDTTSGEPCVDDGGGGGLVGSCMCSRICWDYNVICHLAVSTPNIGCAAGVSGSMCKPCGGKCF